MFWGTIFLLIGIGLLLQNLGYIPKGFDVFWPIIFIAMGISIMFGSKKTDGWCSWNWDEKKDKEKD